MRRFMPTQRLLNLWFQYHPDGDIFWRKRRTCNSPYRPGTLAGYTMHKRRWVNLDNNAVPVARIIWVMHNGPIPEGYIVDHINQQTMDDRIENLRAIPHADNSHNKSMHKNNTSGCTGVHLHRDGKKPPRWYPRIMVRGKMITLGSFPLHEKHKAIEARLKANIQYGFHPNHGRNRTSVAT